jgi:3-dehydroshikimate dehydratase
MILPGLVSVTFRQLDVPEIIQWCQEAKLRGIEWGGDVHVPHGDVKRARQVRQMTLDAGLTIPSYGSYYRVGANHDNDSPNFDAVLECAEAMGAFVIRVWAGNRASNEADEAYWDDVISDSRRIADLSAHEGIQVAFEYHPNTLTDSPGSARRLMEQARHPNLFCYWQPHSEMREETWASSLEDIMPWLSHMHVFYWTDHQRLPLKAGERRWRLLLEKVKSDSKARFAFLEFVKGDDPGQMLEDARTLRGILAE